MSTVAIDTGRNTEQLSAFLSDIVTKDPVENYFARYLLLDKLMASKELKKTGRQALIPINSGENTTVKDFSGYDTFDTSGQDTALTLVYPMVNKGGTLTISWEDEMETVDDEHRIIELLTHKRKTLISTALKQYAQDLFRATQDASKITSLAVAIDSTTGSPGGLSQSTDADWASYERSVGSFATNGMSILGLLYNDIWMNGAMPDTIVMSQTVYQYFEDTADPDTRYNYMIGQSKGDMVGRRGFKSLEFKGIPVTPDVYCTSDVVYMFDSENVWMRVEPAGNYSFDPFEKPANQKAKTSTFACRKQLLIDRRKSTGKGTGITA